MDDRKPTARDSNALQGSHTRGDPDSTYEDRTPQTEPSALIQAIEASQRDQMMSMLPLGQQRASALSSPMAVQSNVPDWLQAMTQQLPAHSSNPPFGPPASLDEAYLALQARRELLARQNLEREFRMRAEQMVLSQQLLQSRLLEQQHSPALGYDPGYFSGLPIGASLSPPIDPVSQISALATKSFIDSSMDQKIPAVNPANPTTSSEVSTPKFDGEPDNSRRNIAFPEKLHKLLLDCEVDQQMHVASFAPNGRAFQVHDEEAFVRDIIPKYFRIKNMGSFRRQLYLYGFTKYREGQATGYVHPHFQRDHPELLPTIRRTYHKASKDVKQAGEQR